MTVRRGGDGPVVLVAHPGTELYGSDRMAAEAVSALVESGATVHVALPDQGPLLDDLRARGATAHVVPMPVLRKSALRPRGALSLGRTVLRSWGPTARLLRRIRPDVVYISTQILPTWVLAGRLAGARTVVHVHEAEQHPSRAVMTGLTAPLLLAHELVVNSEYAASILRAHRASLTTRLVVVYNGVEGPPEPSPARSDTDGALRLAFIGRLSPRKGPDVAIEAARVLRDRGVAVTLTVVGSAFSGYEWFDRALRVAGEDLVTGGSLRFLGFRREVWPELADADVVLVPSTAPEPFGNTAVEARLAGRPLVATRRGGLPEAVADDPAARLVEAGNPEAVADAVQDLVADWARARDDAWRDAQVARRRFAPSRYRRELAAVVLAGQVSGDLQPAERHASVR